MPWFKVDDSFYDHPKVFDAPDCAVSLWTRAGSWASRSLTDGFVPASMPARLCEDPERAVRELLNRGLWKRARGGYQFHDWEDRNPLRADVEEERARKVEAGRLGGLASGRARSKQERRTDKGPTSGLRAKVDGRSSSAREAFDDGRTSDLTSGMTRSKRQAGAKAGASPLLTELPNPRPDPSPIRGRSTSSTHDRTREAPSPLCEEHVNDPDPPPCGRCADARRARERWDLADSNRRRTSTKCRLHRGQPAGNCALCRSEELEAS